jgi:hypothetical protein
VYEGQHTKAHVLNLAWANSCRESPWFGLPRLPTCAKQPRYGAGSLGELNHTLCCRQDWGDQSVAGEGGAIEGGLWRSAEELFRVENQRQMGGLRTEHINPVAANVTK